MNFAPCTISLSSGILICRRFLKQRYKVLLLVTLVWTLSPASSIAATYYLDATKGNDKNSGLSPETAWKTISKVNISNFQPGDFILFKRGEIWREQLVVPSSGAPGQQIVFRAWGQGEKPIISASDIISGWQKCENNIWKTNLGQRPNQLFFNEIRGIEKRNKEELSDEKEWYFFSNILYIYSTENLNINQKNYKIEGSFRDNCVDLMQKSYLSFKDIEFTHANSYYGGNINSWEKHGVHWGSIFIEDCEISYAFGNGIRIQTENSQSVLNSLIIRKCEINNNGVGDNGYGIKIQSNQNVNTNYQNVIISYNELYKNVQEAIRVQNTNSSRVYNNYAYDNGFGNSVESGHILFGNYTSNSEIYNNKCKNSPAEAIWIGTSNIRNIKIYYNIINRVENHHGINISGVDIAEIFNNTIFDTNGGFAIGTDAQSTDIVIENNIVDALKGQNGNVESDNSSTFTSDYNIWDENKVFYPDQVQIKWKHWKEVLKQDSNGYYNDPRMMNPKTDNFRLKPNSICINSGKSRVVKSDIVGTSVPQGGKVDIGSMDFFYNMTAPKNLRIIR
jgi:hypothetical protein